MSGRLKVLVACEFSAVVREAFNRLGHDATSCDLLASEIPGKHVVGDALDVLASDFWDVAVMHPPCTYICNSGVRWMFGGKGTKPDPVRFQQMRDGCDFFARLYWGEGSDGKTHAERVAVENPVMHGHARDYLAEVWSVPGFSQSVQPYEFGHMETKRTCLWLRGLPALVETDNVERAMRKLPKSQTNLVHLATPGPDRWRLRSRTYPGIAEAMAAQWGGVVSASVNVPASFSQPNKTT